MRSARNLYRINLTLAAVGALVVLSGAGVAVGRVDLAPGPIGRLVNDCGSFLPHVTPVGLAILSLGVLGAVVLARGLRSAIRQIRGCHRFLRAIDVVGERRVDQTPVLLIAGTRVQAFCAGFVGPRVYVSRAAADLLSEAELSAVVAHEAHHARRRDPLRLPLLAVLGGALFFLPALLRLRRRYATLTELAADEAAIAAVGDASHLASALLRFGDADSDDVVGVDPERGDHLLGGSPNRDLPAAALGGALLTLAGLLALVFAAATSSTGARTSLAQLAAQSCMLTMTVGPIIALAAIGVFGRRALGRSR